MNATFKAVEYQQAYGVPAVRIRVFDRAEQGMLAWQIGTHQALRQFYGYELKENVGARIGQDVFTEHNQWVSLETPWGELVGDDYSWDPFHRCLFAFNYFLRAAQLITKDVRIRPISSHDLRPVVITGLWPKAGSWRLQSPMLMHPEAIPEPFVTSERPFNQDELNRALASIANGRPYVTTIAWRARAQRSLRQTGDAPDAVVSFQVAAESLLFDTYRMMLIDEGLASTDLTVELQKDRPFKTLITKTIAGRLGGSWDPTRAGGPVSQYWRDLYEVRNAIVHSGLEAHGGHADAAQRAYRALRDFLGIC